MEERAQRMFTAPADDEVERFFGAACAFRCGPQEPVGTLIGRGTMRDLVHRAGYADVQIVPIDRPFWRFYRLTA